MFNYELKKPYKTKNKMILIKKTLCVVGGIGF